MEAENELIADFNKAQKRARVVVEKTIGAVKTRFPVVKYGPRLQNLEDCSKLAQICFALHNFLLDKNNPEEECETEEPDVNNDENDDQGQATENDEQLPVAENENIPEEQRKKLKKMAEKATHQKLLEKYFVANN